MTNNVQHAIVLTRIDSYTSMKIAVQFRTKPEVVKKIDVLANACGHTRSSYLSLVAEEHVRHTRPSQIRSALRRKR